jgi:DNA-binding NtrC family response regulator
VTAPNLLDPVALIVDDEPGIRQVASRFIQQWGFQVVTARNGREAIDLLQHRRIDIVMVDLRMPEVDGLGVLSAIRDSSPDCRAILMTGHTTEETRLEAIKLGALDYLPKPLDWRYLEQRFASIRGELERRQSIFGVESELARRLQFAGMVGRSPVMNDLFDFIRRLAPYARVALVTGETGTG